MTKLLFRRPRDPAQRDIVFGRPAGPALDAEGRLFISLPPVGLIFTGRLEYDLAVSRSDMISTGGSWGAAAPVSPASTAARYRAGSPVGAAHRLTWRPATAQAATTRATWRQLASVPTSKTAAWSSGRPAGAVAAGGWQTGIMLRNSARAPWQSGRPTPAAAAAPWQIAVIIRRPGDRIRWGAGDPTPISVAVRAASAVAVLPVTLRLPWDAAERLPPGRTVIIIPPQPPVWRCYTPPSGDQAHLLFDERRRPGNDLLFTCGRGAPSGALIIPALRVYIVINSASLTRVSNNLPLPITGLSISIDADSAHWTWSATLPLRALADLEPDAPGEPVELEAMVNGHVWRLLVERLAESERFGQASLQIGGRGIAAELSDPIYPVVSHGNPDAAAMAQQLAAAALTINGVPLGWAVDWTAADWLIPAGAWVHRGTPLDAVARIAAAAGAYVQAAPAARSLRIRPRYPLAPWDWASAAPDIVLPADAVMERGTEHALRPAYDSVYVSGEAGGVLARVKRAGFAGNTPAPMVVDALVTHADAARGRGLEVLGNTGAQRLITLETGILPASGVIHVGSLLDWTRGPQVARGLVRSLAVSASGGNSDAPVKVRQTVGVEVHD